MMLTYPFTEDQAHAAFEEWGCNCGPAALAFACGVGLDEVRRAIPGFEEKRYTSPTMMKAALANLGREFDVVKTELRELPGSAFGYDRPSLVRVQWTGPWTSPGANGRWAYQHTHWIATWRHLRLPSVFDVNGGVMSQDRWNRKIVPLITGSISRADGGYFPTHIWRLRAATPAISEPAKS